MRRAGLTPSDGSRERVWGGGEQVKSTGRLILYNTWRGDEDSWQGWGWMSTSKWEHKTVTSSREKKPLCRERRIITVNCQAQL